MIHPKPPAGYCVVAVKEGHQIHKDGVPVGICRSSRTDAMTRAKALAAPEELPVSTAEYVVLPDGPPKKPTKKPIRKRRIS